MSDTRRIYVACLASYNNGKLHGAWIDTVGKGADELRDEVNAILRTSPEPSSEEWAIHGHEGFGSLLEEYTGLAEVAALDAAIEEHGDVYIAYAEHVGARYATSEGFSDAYLGTYDSVTDYAQSYVDDSDLLAGLSENLRNYFDVEAFGRDMVLSGDIFAVEISSGGSVAIFSNH